MKTQNRNTLILTIAAGLFVCMPQIGVAGDIVGVVNDPALQRFVDKATVRIDGTSRRAR